MVEELLSRFEHRIGPKNEIELRDTNRVDLARFIHDLKLQVGVELGVAAGDYSKVLLEYNPQMKLYSVDSWAPYKNYKDYTKDSTFAALEGEARRKLGKFDNSQIIKGFSDEAVKHFEDESLDFVYIDANHRYEYALFDIIEWGNKVRPGGIVAGHDYARVRARNGETSDNWGVIPAMDEYRRNNLIKLYIWGFNGVESGILRDGARSWMFVK